MIFLPARPGEKLSDLLWCLEYASLRNPAVFDGCPAYNWFSVVAAPVELVDQALLSKYGQDLEQGWVEFQADEVPRGWISNQDKALIICTGTSRAHNKRENYKL